MLLTIIHLSFVFTKRKTELYICMWVLHNLSAFKKCCLIIHYILPPPLQLSNYPTQSFTHQSIHLHLCLPCNFVAILFTTLASFILTIWQYYLSILLYSLIQSLFQTAKVLFPLHFFLYIPYHINPSYTINTSHPKISILTVLTKYIKLIPC